jgi:hypothetical protein
MHAMVELVMQVWRGDGDRLSGSVRLYGDPESRPFSGTLELMRVFEDLVPSDDPHPTAEAPR